MSDFSVQRFRGGFAAVWNDGGGRRRYKLSATSRPAAEAEARDLFARSQSPAAGLTVSDLWSAYRHDRAGRRIDDHMGMTGKAILPEFGHLRPDQITTDDCRAYIARRREAGRSEWTIHTEMGHLRIVVKWAEDTGRIDRAPKIERNALPAPADRWLTEAEVARLLAAECDPHIKLAIHLMLATAGRVGAILELTWDRVYFDRGQIDLRASADGPRKGRAVVPINGTLRAALLSAKVAALSDFVVEYAGRQVRSIRNGFATAVQNAGLTDVTPHVLRHTAAVHMAAAGIPMQKIAQFLGHTNTAITERTYARFSPEHLTDAAAAVDFGRLHKVQ
ncbi:site-specific integrase [Cereibacter sphaeroides]|nr:site-specific integrase [Cereibacter sphaeroides]AZB65003.1 site-specific integrase [Cereibacter sphaeroides]AZB67114.1 site-specific integrase [Cereibacter sphaeroides]